jgi:hypothetical protein
LACRSVSRCWTTAGWLGAWALAAFALLSGGGCALNDYERKLQSAQDYLDEVDKENEFLGNPIKIPVKAAPVGAQPGAGAAGPPAGPPGGAPAGPAGPPAPGGANPLALGGGGASDLFFRPPKGIASDGTEVLEGVMWLYGKDQGPTSLPAPGGGPVLAPAGPGGGAQPPPGGKAQPPKETPVTEVYVAFQKNSERDKFWEMVLKQVRGLDPAKAKEETVRPAGRKPFRFWALDDGAPPLPATTYAYFFIESGPAPYQVALVFKVDPAKAKGETPGGLNPYLVNQLKYSRQSLTVGRDAVERNRSFKPRR